MNNSNNRLTLNRPSDWQLTPFLKRHSIKYGLYNPPEWGVCIVNAFIKACAICERYDHIWRDLPNCKLKQSMERLIRDLRQGGQITLDEQIHYYKSFETHENDSVDLAIERKLVRTEPINSAKIYKIFENSWPSKISNPEISLAVVDSEHRSNLNANLKNCYDKLEIIPCKTKSEFRMLKPIWNIDATFPKPQFPFILFEGKNLQEHLDGALTLMREERPEIDKQFEILQLKGYLDIDLVRPHNSCAKNVEIPRHLTLNLRSIGKTYNLFLQLVFVGNGHAFVMERTCDNKGREVWIQHDDMHVEPYDPKRNYQGEVYNSESAEELIEQHGGTFHYIAQ